MAKTKILFVSHEMSPFLELTNIAKITRELPQAMQERGCEIRVLVPRFGNINERRNRLHEVIRLSGMNIVINDNDNPLIIKVASIPAARMQVYFLDNEEYFQRKYVFRDGKNKFYDDNDERMIFFCKGALETVKKLGWAPDVVHCHGWMSSLVPMYLKTTYKDDPTFKHAKIVYSAYENCFTEKLNKEFTRKAVLNDMNANDTKVFNEGDCGDIHIGAMNYADAIIKASTTLDKKVEDFIATQHSKPVLNASETTEFDVYAQFYDEILSEDMAALEA